MIASSAGPLAVILIILYFVPAIVAAARHHHNTLSIFVLDLLLGWSVIGWIVALVMACSNPPPAARVDERPL